MRQPSYKAVGFELLDLKASASGWTFSGYASTFGNVDEGGDVVLRGAFAESLKNRPKPKLLWQHQSSEPLGVVQSLREDDRGLFGEWKLSKTARGADAYELLKDGAVDSMSIGYIPEDVEFDDEFGIRKLKSVDLLEVSVVTIPMNEEAIITAVKAATSQMLPIGSHAGLVLDQVRAFADRYREVLRLRAEKGKVPGEEARRAIEEVKAMIAELDVPAPVAERGVYTASLSPRLEIARRRALMAGVA